MPVCSPICPTVIRTLPVIHWVFSNIFQTKPKNGILRRTSAIFRSVTFLVAFRVLLVAFGVAPRTGGERTYVSRYLCSPVPMFPEPMFPSAYVPRYLCSPVPMFPGFCTLIVVISINRLQILPTPWYDSRLGLCLGFRFRVLVRIRVRVRLELQTVFRLWLGCGLGLSLCG